ncbi:MAG: FAD binding domain-containing protein [Acidobacteriota bacterium]|jgi:carbon-monoxide dehydrogenase medium subunit
MIPAEFDYRRASTVEEAISMLADHADARLIAGGHSLLPMMKMRLAAPAMLIDIGGIAELTGIRRVGDELVIGALTRHAEVAASDEVAARHAALAHAAAAIGDVQVRNFGTLGGSLAHADPAADYPAAVIALEGVIDVLGSDGARSIAAADLITGMLTTSLAHDEIITAVRFPTVDATGSAYEKFAQPASGYAIVGVAAVIGRGDDGACNSARLAATGVGEAPLRLPAAEEALLGSALDDAALAAAADAARTVEVDHVRSDLYAAEDYRRHLLGVVTARAVRRAAS